jgi:protein TonB
MSPPPLSHVLPPMVRSGLLLGVVFCHVGGVWALTRFEPPLARTEPPRQRVQEIPRMEIRVAVPEAPPQPAPDIEIPLPEDTEPPDLRPEPQLELAVPTQMPDLPPPVFPAPVSPPVAAKKVPGPLPIPARPRQALVTPPLPQAVPPAPDTLEASTGGAMEPPARSDPQSTVRTITEAQIRYRVRPRPVYPLNSAQARESGFVMVSALIDTSGRPEKVLLDQSSTHGRLDREALRAVQEALFDPYVEEGVPRPARVIVWIHFKLVYRK